MAAGRGVHLTRHLLDHHFAKELALCYLVTVGHEPRGQHALRIGLLL